MKRVKNYLSDLKEEGHGIFTYYYLFEGLNGNEDSVDKYRNVTVSSLGNFVYDAIVNLSEEKRSKQKPLTKTEGDGNIILAQYPSLAKLTVVHYPS
jgi:hypothetical protein